MSVYRTIGPLVYDLKKKLTPVVILTLPRVIYMYITILVIQVYWYISQVSGERLQDHWSSVFLLLYDALKNYTFST